MTTAELIEKLERADGPSRELDASIQRAFAGSPSDHWFADHKGVWVSDDSAPRYTASIDAALTLVPEGALWSAEAWDTNGVYPAHVRASAWVLGAPRGYAATPAIALCIAALKAKEADNG